MTLVGKLGLAFGGLGIAALAAASVAAPTATAARVEAVPVRGEIVLAQAPGPAIPATPPAARERRPGGGGSGDGPLNAPESNELADELPPQRRGELRFQAAGADVRVDREGRRVRVNAPYADVAVDPRRVRVRGPYVNLDIRW